MKRFLQSLFLSFWMALTLGLVPVAAVAAPAPAPAAPTVTCGSGFSIDNGINCGAPSGSKETDIFGKGGIFKTIANTLLIILGAVSIIMIIIGGFRYVLSGGSSSNVNGAKDTIMYALIGLIVAILAGAFVNFVVSKF